MVLIFTIAAAAALAVVLYARLAEDNPEMVDTATKKVHQLSAVVLVLSRAVEGVADALQATVRRQPRVLLRRPDGGPRLVDNDNWGMFDDE